MDDFLGLGGSPKKKKGKSILDSGLDLGLKPSKKQKNPLNLGINLESSEKPKRDSRRAFTQTQKKEILYQQGSKCARCHKKLDPREIEYDHKKPWAAGGKTTTVKNGRALCGSCHKIITHTTRLKEVDKKRASKNKSNMFGLPT